MKMRRKDREMDENFALSVVDSCPFGTLSMTLPDGSPYAVALSIAREGMCVYFHSAQAGLKTEALLHEPRVCLTCVTGVQPIAEEFSTAYASAVLFGQAQLVADAAERAQALRLICRRYAPENLENMESCIQHNQAATAVWRITIQSISGKQKRLPNA